MLIKVEKLVGTVPFIIYSSDTAMLLSLFRKNPVLLGIF
jgi:hypothetical protein